VWVGASEFVPGVCPIFCEEKNGKNGRFNTGLRGDGVEGLVKEGSSLEAKLLEERENDKLSNIDNAGKKKRQEGDLGPY